MATITIVFHGEARVGKTRLASLLLPALKSSARSLGVTIGLRSELPLVRASVEATRKVIAKAEVSR